MSYSNALKHAQFANHEAEHGSIDMPELISALSFALDLTEGAVPGHALRSCVLGMRIGVACGLQQNQLTELYYALLLKDIGCSSNAAHLNQIVQGEDDAAQARARAAIEEEVWADIRADLQEELDRIGGGVRASRPSPLRKLWNSARAEKAASKGVVRQAAEARISKKEVVKLHGDRGASIIAKIGLSKGTAEAVRALDEHWDGTGYPGRWRGDRIPLLARIAAVAQHLDVFASETGPENAIFVLRQRTGKWFDPEIVRIATSLHRSRILWKDCLAILPEADTRRSVLDLEPREDRHLGPERVDRICEAFSDVVDAKSPFTVRHSLGVADAALGIAHTLGLSPERTQFVRRAALLHDIGKLHIPNALLEKQGKLTVEEFLIIKQHPALTQQILGRIPSFREMAWTAGAHHEKLDGTGYPNQLESSQLSLETRIVAVADVYSALSEERPYRESLDLDQIKSIMSKDIPQKLDSQCFDALLFSLKQGSMQSAASALVSA